VPSGATCIDGARDRYGVCYATELRYDCGTTAEIPEVTREIAMHCAGPVRCLGNDCLDLTFEQSEDFTEAAAALQTAQYVLSDSDCTRPGQCQIFKGNAAECKQAVGGIVDCCQRPAGVSLVDYIQLIVAMTKIDSAIMASESGSSLRGGWELLRDPLVDTWDAVSETITSAANNLVGNTAAATSEAGARFSLDAAKQALLRQTVEWTAQVFGDAAANALFAVEGGGSAVVNGTVQAGNLQLGGLIGTTLAWAMTAYLIQKSAQGLLILGLRAQKTLVMTTLQLDEAFRPRSRLIEQTPQWNWYDLIIGAMQDQHRSVYGRHLLDGRERHPQRDQAREQRIMHLSQALHPIEAGLDDQGRR